MLEQKLAAMKAQLEEKLETMSTDDIATLLANDDALGDESASRTDEVGGGDDSLADAVAGVQEAIQDDLTLEDGVEMVHEIMNGDASIEEGVAAVQVTLADEPDEVDVDDAAALEEEDATVTPSEEAEAIAQIDAIEGAGGEGEGDGEDAEDDEGSNEMPNFVQAGLRVDRAIPVPPAGPVEEDPERVRRMEPKMNAILKKWSDAEHDKNGDLEESSDAASKPKYFGDEGAAAIPAEYTVFGPQGVADAGDSEKSPLLTTTLHERTAKAVKAMSDSKGPAVEGMTGAEAVAAEAKHLANFAEEEESGSLVQKEPTVDDDQSAPEESSALMNQR